MRSVKKLGLVACVLFGAAALVTTSVEAGGCGPGGCGGSYGGWSYSSGGCANGSCSVPAPGGQAYRSAPRSTAPTYAYRPAPRYYRAPQSGYVNGRTYYYGRPVQTAPRASVARTPAPAAAATTARPTSTPQG